MNHHDPLDIAPAVNADEPVSVSGWIRRTRGAVAAQPVLLQLGGAALLTGIAAGLSVLVQPILSQSVFLVFYLAVTLSAAFGGRLPGLLATVLSALAAYVLLLPHLEDRGGMEGLFLVLTFVVVGALVSSVIHAFDRARGEADVQKITANEFAAALHLRLMLAEKEIERLNGLLAEIHPSKSAPDPESELPAGRENIPSPVSPPMLP